jgi:arrestin-related trafficking adapter 3/6
MLNSTLPVHSKHSLTITLTEPLVILRTVDDARTRTQRQPDGISSPSMLRGLLALDLAKSSKISSIDVELQVTSWTPWSEGMRDHVFPLGLV